MKAIQRKIATTLFAAGLMSIGGSALAEEATPVPNPSTEDCKFMYDALQTALAMGNQDVSMAIMKRIAERGC
jgi:hypothetical protein